MRERRGLDMRLNGFVWAMLGLSLGICAVGCSDDGYTNDHGLGAPCTCEGDGCAVMGIPLPVPVNDSTVSGQIVGCENVDTTGMTGGVVACLRTIAGDAAIMAPPVWAPKGYCTYSAVKTQMENERFAQMATYGDADALTACPKGSTLLESTFDYEIVGQQAVVLNKTCARSCTSDSDCNGDGEMTCITKGNARFCYNEENFKFMKDYTATPF